MYKDMGCQIRGPRSLLQHHMDDSTSAHLALLTDVCLRQRQQISCLKTAVQSIASSTDGTTLFRITDFSARLSEARAGKSGGEVRSAPFYTHRYGYKLAASVFPNGNGCGDGTHLSVYMRLVPGEYDSLLEWPFMQTVSFTLFDQTECAEKRADVTESFAPEPGWRHFQRPSRDDCDNLGFGFPTFVSHSALKKRSYAKDDVVFIRVRVHSPKYIENSVI
ncbi:PREDICTED: TNF receptor-associated factor 4-like [Priapulus caudatus]|uniref:TNF receptor-associated factor 4-like n=1 Tax=Priapulus caudatus TaxID=37621 RepID=A0ABM1F5L4_PRICU|nr:PREDICTED: TNF receptor-associated factor 4-like [Priapulus caudatus]